jgi:drug/metabolite transporter (DMT)-like permease
MQKKEILAELRPFVNHEVSNYIKNRRIDVDDYLLYAYKQVLKTTKIVGVVGTIILTAGLGYLAFLAAFENNDPSVPSWLKIGFPILFSSLGLTIGLIAMRNVTKDKVASSYILIGVSQKLKLDYIKKIDQKKWDKIKSE